MADLKRVPTEALEDELYRRRRWREEREPKPMPYCDECAHFKASPDAGADYNPCSKGHKMSFRVPDGPTTTDWGFYRAGCADRSTDIGE